MKRTASIDKILKPLADTPFQAYLSNAVQVADILDWILSQVGLGNMADLVLHFRRISPTPVLHHEGEASFED